MIDSRMQDRPSIWELHGIHMSYEFMLQHTSVRQCCKRSTTSFGSLAMVMVCNYQPWTLQWTPDQFRNLQTATSEWVQGLTMDKRQLLTQLLSLEGDQQKEMRVMVLMIEAPPVPTSHAAHAYDRAHAAYPKATPKATPPAPWSTPP